MLENIYSYTVSGLYGLVMPSSLNLDRIGQWMDSSH